MLNTITTSAGVYVFKDKDGRVIYIGKAKSLRNRVRSYFHQKNERLATLANDVATIAVIPTTNETEALLLEARLIQEHQPHYNVLLKTGQPFVYLLFTNEQLPRLELVRNKKKRGKYIGPFLHKNDARNVYAYLLKTFRLKMCGKNIAGGCLDYHLDLCPGTCTGTVNIQDYCFRLDLAHQVLTNDPQSFLASLKARIAEHSKALNFEQAQHLAAYMHHFDVIFATVRAHYHERKYAKEAALATAPVHYAPQTSPELAQQLKDFLRLATAPRTIDCFDVSHFQSTFIVGSCIRFTNGSPDKNRFRRFRIRSLTEQNDYAALQEIVKRRYKKVADLPDLILIDGGKGQLNAVQGLFPHIPFISLAKAEEIIFSHQFPDGIALPLHTDVGLLLRALRDYAHHFAIQYHRIARTASHIK